MQVLVHPGSQQGTMYSTAQISPVNMKGLKLQFKVPVCCMSGTSFELLQSSMTSSTIARLVMMHFGQYCIILTPQSALWSRHCLITAHHAWGSWPSYMDSLTTHWPWALYVGGCVKHLYQWIRENDMHFKFQYRVSRLELQGLYNKASYNTQDQHTASRELLAPVSCINIDWYIIVQ